LTICGIRCANSAVILLTSTTTVPIYGKLADLYGRKPLFLFGTAIFLIGSAASGAAQTMEQLIIFRAIQGLGAGAVLPLVLTIIGDIFALKERAKVQGLFSGVCTTVALRKEGRFPGIVPGSVAISCLSHWDVTL
jgi:MFS family permease